MKFNKNKEWLIEEYVVKNRKLADVAADCGLKPSGLRCVLDKFGIKKEKFNIKEDYLRKLVYEDKLNAQQIADVCKCNKTSVYNYLKKYNLQIQAEPIKHEQYDDSHDDEICELYTEFKLSSTEIAKIFGVTHNTILTHLKHCGVDRRTLSESQFNYQGKEYPKDFTDKDKMIELYINKKLSKKSIAEIYNCDPCAVDLALKKLNIPIRNNSESKKGLMVGEKHPNWKGGITALHQRLREYFYVNQVPLVSKRDNYTCQLCGKTHTILHVHHIKRFSEILKRIVIENNHLDPLKDVNELYEIAVKDSEFNDLNNLITYCKDCHFHKIHGYKKQNSLAENKPIELLEPSEEVISSQALIKEGSETIENTSGKDGSE